MQSIAFAIHYMVNPETVLTTMAPSLVVSSIYVTLYNLGLAKVASGKDVENNVQDLDEAAQGSLIELIFNLHNERSDELGFVKIDRHL